MSKKAVFNLNLHSEQVLAFYKGQKTAVRVVSTEGQSMSIPFDILIKFVTHNGISGTFEIYFQDDGKFEKIRKIK